MNRSLAVLAWFVVASSLVASTSRADDAPSNGGAAHAVEKTGASIGVALHRFQDDFGVGATLTTPAFLGDVLRLTAGGGVAWLPHVAASDGTEDRKTYGHARLVVEVGPPLVAGASLRPYGFGGVTTIFLPSSVASSGVGVGGIGGFGFEFPLRYPDARAVPPTFFLELGGIGIGKHADKVAGSPLVANGFLLTVGLRLYP
jgi:hypothetical protein